MASAPPGRSWASMKEMVYEEMAKLEAALPGRFGTLKADLERLIGDPGLDDFPLIVSPPRAAAGTGTTPAALSQQPAADHSRTAAVLSVCTQESSTSTRKRKPRSGGVGKCEDEGKRTVRRQPSTAPAPAPTEGPMESADLAIERCLRLLVKTREFKQSLLADRLPAPRD